MIPRYRVLGPSRALRADGQEALLSGARLRALLAAPAAAGGRGVGAGELIDRIWENGPPQDPTGALQALVGRLRRTLGREAAAATTGGYRLAAGPEDIDLHVFERRAAEGSGALATGDPARAARLLDGGNRRCRQDPARPGGRRAGLSALAGRCTGRRTRLRTNGVRRRLRRPHRTRRQGDAAVERDVGRGAGRS